MRPYRLDRMKAMLAMFGNPQNLLKTVHISGSKGKGSTGVYIASALSELGRPVGLYTSPHVSSYKERITLAGREIDDEVIAAQADFIRAKIAAIDPELLPGQSDPTTFELLTLLAYLVFVESECEWAVIETGIGGRLDATNVQLPQATVHTLIELEHTEVLGNTLAEIAYEKAGIIKPGVPAFCGFLKPEVEEVFVKKASQVGAPITFLKNKVRSQSVGDGTEPKAIHIELDSRDVVDIVPGMVGAFQRDNAVLAFITADHLLQKLGLHETERRRKICDGIAKARLPGRMELIRLEPPVMLDAAHTPSSVQRLLESYVQLFPEPGVLIFGSVLGKNSRAMAQILAPAFRSIIISTPGTFKESDPEGVFREFNSYNEATELLVDPEQAYRRALSMSDGRAPILVAGSFYMIAEIRRLEMNRAKGERVEVE